MGMFSHLSDEHVERLFHAQAETIVRVQNMPPEERNKGTVQKIPPSSAVRLNAHFFVGAAHEMEARGMLPKGWLDADD